MDVERLSRLARSSEDALRDAALRADAAEADALTDRAGERASQVEQLRALERPHGATASALEPSPHPLETVEATEIALAAACQEALADERLSNDARALLSAIIASCR